MADFLIAWILGWLAIMVALWIWKRRGASLKNDTEREGD